ncbi:DsbC family protein [Rhodoferax sp.]|uniref:DsbC family protein n=1 Tax=Rhodoferax sp. TaxID=50421 RepID=UPI002726C9C5|nr:DsbC family protein [Rhodoferax sp.]MDO9197685.1 DsbC family protein [Rhodoferax sp.]
MKLTDLIKVALAAATLVASLGAAAQEALIRKNLGERIPQLQKIDEVTKSPMPGLFEIRVNDTEIFYTDVTGNFLIKGHLIDTQQRRNLTEERVDKLTAISFDALPLRDAFTIVRGNGKRTMAVFGDPNCGYCKRFEKDLEKVDNVTIHMFLYPILSADSNEKSRNIWCAKDKGTAWQNWMLRDQMPKAASCDTAAIERNLELGRKYKISGTPTLIFANGNKVPGAIGTAQIEQHLTQAKN